MALNKFSWFWDGESYIFYGSDEVKHKVMFRNGFWVRECSNSHIIAVPEEVNRYKALDAAKSSCEDFENRLTTELEIYEFEIDRKTDD